jgi:hypothetical protein
LFSPVERVRAGEVFVQRSEVEDEEDEAVFAAVVGEGQGAEAAVVRFMSASARTFPKH